MIDLLLGLLPVQKFRRKHHQDGLFYNDNLVLSTGLIMWIGHRKEIRKLTFPALALRRSESNLVILPTRNLTPLFIFTMEWLGVVAGNFAASFSLEFRSIFVHIPGSIEPITLIWVSLKISFPHAKLESRWCQVWSKVMTSEVEQRLKPVTSSYGRQGSQWVNWGRPLNRRVWCTLNIF